MQQLQESNPSQYQQVAQETAGNLQSAANTAQANGNTAIASQLNQLATDFTNASQTGQLRNVQDLAQALGGGGHHHHHHIKSSSGDSDGDSSSSGSSSSGSAGAGPVSQMLAAFQANAAQNNSLNPAAIIFNTLSGAGLL